VKNGRIPLTDEEKQDRRAITILLGVLWLMISAAITAEVFAIVPFIVWYERVRGL